MKRFKGIYKEMRWGESRLYPGHGGSGLGSSVEYVQELIEFLQQYIVENRISSFLDIGCGECEWQRTIDWENLDCEYVGIEILPEVVKRVRLDLAARQDMTIIQGDCLQMSLPETDLIFVKEVIQHWPICLTNNFFRTLYSATTKILTYNCENSSSLLRYMTYRYFISNQLEVHDKVVDNIVVHLKQIDWDTDIGGFRPCNSESYGSRLCTFNWKWHFPAALVKIDRLAIESESRYPMFTDDSLRLQIQNITGNIYKETDIYTDTCMTR